MLGHMKDFLIESQKGIQHTIVLEARDLLQAVLLRLVQDSQQAILAEDILIPEHHTALDLLFEAVDFRPHQEHHLAADQHLPTGLDLPAEEEAFLAVAEVEAEEETWVKISIFQNLSIKR